MVKIAPSMLSADFSHLADEVIKLTRSGADMLHWDVMDGHYVPNLTFGPQVIKALRKYSNLPFDIHLMVQNPDDMLPWFRDIGADILTVHAEACTHLDKTIDTIRNMGVKVGVSLNPSTSEQVLEYVIDRIDLILVMSVNPGFGGQSFIDAQLDKISRIKEMIGRRNIQIEVDGGINPLTAAQCIARGADVLVAGTSVFAGGDYAKNIASLR